MADSDQVASIIAAMSTSKDGWHLSCELDDIRNDGKIVAAFHVGYGDAIYVLATGNYGNDGKSDLVQGVLYVPGDHPHSSDIFIRTPMWVRVKGAMYWSFSDTPWPLIKDGKKSPDREDVSVSSDPVIIPREVADWVIDAMTMPEAIAAPGECKPIKFSVKSNADYWGVRVPSESCDLWNGLGIQLLDGGLLEEVGLSKHGEVVSRVLKERWDADILKRKFAVKYSSDGNYVGMIFCKLRGSLDWVGLKVLDCIKGHCDDANLHGSTVDQVFFAVMTSMDQPVYPEWRITEGAADYRAVCNIATDWKHWQYFQQCSDEQAILHVIHRNFDPVDISPS